MEQGGTPLVPQTQSVATLYINEINVQQKQLNQFKKEKNEVSSMEYVPRQDQRMKDYHGVLSMFYLQINFFPSTLQSK